MKNEILSGKKQNIKKPLPLLITSFYWGKTKKQVTTPGFPLGKQQKT